MLESITIDHETLHCKNKLALDYADLIYDGKWFLTRLKNILSFSESKKPYFRAIDCSVDEFDSKVNYIYSTRLLEGLEIDPLPTGKWNDKIIIQFFKFS